MSRDPLARLEEARRSRPGARAAEVALESAAVFVPRDATELARLHDAALFLRVYPQSPRVLALAEALLARVPAHAARLAGEGADLAPLDDPSVAGIAGVPVAMPFSHAAASWLARRDPSALRVDWDAEDLPDRLAAFLPRFVPFLEEQARVDANVAFRDWVDAARGARPDAPWLLERLAAFPLPDSVRAELWEALSLQLVWTPRAADSRGLARVPSPAPFCSDTPLLSRRDVSVATELAGPPPRLVRLSRREGAALLDAARAAMAIRYRELPAFSAGDPSAVFRFDVGRGVSIFVTGLARDARLPLRAAFGTLFARNGVLVGYGDLHASLGRADVSFNVFYAFRDGESAWLYARLLAVARAVTHAAQLSVDPYQVGLGNEEAIASGAFWFYRKLGFRSADPALERLARREEARLAAAPSRRTPAATLRRLAVAPLLLDVPGETPLLPDSFRLADLGRAAARRFAASKLSPEAFRARAAGRAARALGLDPVAPACRASLEALAPALALLDDLASWPLSDRRALVALLRAKAAPDELRYARLSSGHRRLAASIARAVSG
ncbi:MAG TPA: hypothetical protein PLP50_11860 [Thermoanaerobaculia bacterium]|nr:hypothetical protein [Thermoanaerobaculia bacterium]HQN08146.1 hypothetical protein [Thermoanaerobaculia bacterium]HQP88166.1 hypothetical protein [Thermoanaerobaculia bacterium]